MVTDVRPLGDTVKDASAPSIEDILDKQKSANEYFRNFHQQCKEEEDYYFLRKQVPVPDGSDPVRPATARAIIDVAADHVDVNNLSIDVPIMLRSKARAERLQKYYQAIWANIKTPVKRTAVKHSFIYGQAWLKQMFVPQEWNDSPRMDDYGVSLENGKIMLVDEQGYKEATKDFLERRKLLFPFSVENVNPREMIWDDSRTGPKWVIRQVSATVRDMKQRFSNWTTSRGPGEMSTFSEYWDDTWYGYFADGSFIHGPFRHGYGFLPFVPVTPANTLDWDAGTPEDRYQGILKPVHNLLDSEARIISQIHAIMHTVSYRTLDFSGPTHLAAQARDNYELWGGMNVIPPGVDVRPSPFIQVPPDLLNQLSMVQTMIEEATFPNVVRGLRPKGVSTGFGVSVLAGMGRLRFQGGADGMARAIEILNSGFAKLLENVVRSSVTVHARSEIHNFDETIRPADVKGYYENIVRLKAEAPEERERESILANQLHQGGLISLYEAQRRIGITNPLDEQVQMAAEQMVAGARDQQLQEFLASVAASESQQLQGGRGDMATQFQPGQAQLQRPGEAGIQRQRMNTRNEASVFPRGLGGLDVLGRALGTPGGGATGMPSGQTVR